MHQFSCGDWDNMDDLVQIGGGRPMANVGGPPTDNKPAVTLVPPLQVELASYALNVRVADVQTVYELWRSRGAHFLTPPIARDGEIRCYLRDPDGHHIELGQSVPDARS